MVEITRLDQPRQGALLLGISALLFAIMGVMIREVSTGVNNETVVFFRNFVGIFFFLPLFLLKGLAPFKTQRIGSHFMRTFYGLAAMYCFFYAIAHLPLADAMMFTYAAPVFTPLLAWWWLRESLTPRIMFTVLIGFAGVLLVAKPSGAIFEVKALAGVAASLLAACAFVSIRAMSNTEPAIRMVFYFTTFSTLISAIPMLWAWQPLDQRQLILLISIGLLATTSQFVMSKAYTLAPPGKIGPLSYLAIVFSGIFAWYLWGEVPGLASFIGAALIFGATMLSILMPGKTPAPRP
ncbi:MAG: DMT family transporter [Gammaproteobacteria bacterium]|nr:DMT family transporter [Gammaproteobacteria bacterium]